MQQHRESLVVATHAPGLYEITDALLRIVMDSGVASGLATAYCRHTSCSLLVQENADPDVKTDLIGFFRRLAPEGMDWIVHDAEGPDDMPAPIRAALTQSSVSIPVANGRPLLGT